MDNNTWPLQDAKNKFSEVVREALTHGPQKVTRHGEEMVVIMSIQDYQKSLEPKDTLIDFFQNSPLKGIQLDLERKKDFARDVSL